MLQVIELKHPWHAVALSLLGHSCYARATLNDSTGATAMTWHCKSGVATAAAIVAAAERPASDPRSIHTLAPEHPFLIALYALEAVQILTEWLLHPGQPPAVIRPSPRGRLLRLSRFGAGTEMDITPLYWTTAGRAGAVRSPEDAAAIIVGGGFIPFPGITDTPVGSQPGIAFAGESLTFPGVQLAMLPQAATVPLPGWPDGAHHPFLWARAAIAKQSQQMAAADQAASNPSILFKGRGQRAALVSANLLEESAPSSLRDRLNPHLNGLT